MRALPLLALLAWFAPVQAADLVLQLPAGTRNWSSAELLTHPQAQALDLPMDVAYKRAMTYRAVPLAALLEGVQPGDHLQAQALDGFAAELPAAPLLTTQGARAWLAVEDPAQPWPSLAPGKPGAGPFYLVWSDPQAGNIGPEQWPYQLAAIRRLAPLAERFPALLPNPGLAADDTVHKGFALFQKHCLACHRLNGAGDAQFGPDLNIPHNPTEYFSADFLRQYIRDPQSLRRWPQGRMPGFTSAVLSDAELEHLLGYLRHMTGRKLNL
ncbi:MAG: cytochrome c [Pseudomonadota bacterium]